MENFDVIEKEIGDLLSKSEENHNSIQSIAASRYIDYAASVILGRAIPDINDGLKPVHRRILQSMKDLHLSPSGAPKKSARIVGNTIGIYHPHGDTSVYDAMVALSQSWTKMVPLVIGQGNFGSVDGDSPAAMRYTEAKLSKAGQLFFQDIDKNVVDFKDNYDSTEKEPFVLPVPFPNLLINGGSGVAAGMASNIPSHNPSEILDALIYVAREKKKERNISIDKIVDIVKGPDFPTGGYVYDTQNMKEIIQTGKGKVRIRAKHEVEKVGRNKYALIVTEIPYQTNKSKIIEEIVVLVKDKKLENISLVRDESNKKGLRIYIELKSNTDPELVWNFIVKNSNLDISFSYNFTVIKNQSPVESNIIEALDSFVEFRKEIQQRKYIFIKGQAESRLEILYGLLKALKDIDKVISLIKKANTEEDALYSLISAFKLTERQAKAILDMRIQKLIGMEKLKLEKERDDQEKIVDNANIIIDSDELKYDIIIEETRKMKKEIGFERVSQIDNTLSNVDLEDIIPREECVVFVTHKGYLRRVPVSTLNKQNRGTKGSRKIDLQEADFIIQTFNTNSHSILLFVTENGKVYGSKAYKIPDNIKGRFVANIFEMDEGDKIVTVVEAIDFNEDKELIMATEKGYIKKTSLSEYTGTLRSSGVIGIKLGEGDSVVYSNVLPKNLESEVLLINASGKIIRFDLKEISSIGRNSKGVIGMRLEGNDKVIGGDLSSNPESLLLTIGKRGTLKASSLGNYKKQKRAGKGVFAMKVTSKTGELIKALLVPEDIKNKELVLTSKNGISNRIALDKLKVQARKTAGVNAMKLNKGDSIVDAFVTEKYIEENEGE